MKSPLSLAALALISLSPLPLVAAPFEPNLADFSFPGSQYTVDSTANAHFDTHFGIQVDNAYLYRDARDTFDGIGFSVGEASAMGTWQTGRITFLDTTDFVSLDYWAIFATSYSILDAFDQVMETLSVGHGAEGSFTFTAPQRIQALTWTSYGGFGQVQGLRYDYDGVTDGRNVHLDALEASHVPESVPTWSLAALTLLGLVGWRRRA